MGVQDGTVGEPHQDVLGRGVDRGDLDSGLRTPVPAPVAAELEAGDALARQRGPQLRGHAKDRVAFGHAPMLSEAGPVCPTDAGRDSGPTTARTGGLGRAGGG